MENKRSKVKRGYRKGLLSSLSFDIEFVKNGLLVQKETDG